jgi:hypothetical protein
MSTVFFNLIRVTGPRAKVLRFRTDARRRLSALHQSTSGFGSVDLSFEKLFRKHPTIGSRREVPGDAGHYLATSTGTDTWHRFTRTAYELEVKNSQIHELLKLLSRHYPELCFVNSEICLDDGSVLSAFVRKGTCNIWDLPESRQNAHWRRGAVDHDISLEQAYGDDEVRADVERGMLAEALDHWDNRVLRALRSS